MREHLFPSAGSPGHDLPERAVMPAVAGHALGKTTMGKSAGERFRTGANAAPGRQMSRHLCRREDAVSAMPVCAGRKGCSSFRIFHARPVRAGKRRTGAFPCQIFTVSYSGFFPYAAALRVMASGRPFPYSRKSCPPCNCMKCLPAHRFSTGPCRTNGTSPRHG